MLVDKLKYVRMCSRKIEELQIQYLKMRSDQNDQDKLEQIMHNIEKIQTLKKTFNDTEFTSDWSLYKSSEKLEKDLLSVGKNDSTRYRRDYKQAILEAMKIKTPLENDGNNNLSRFHSTLER